MQKEENIKIYKNESSSILESSNSDRYIIVKESTSAHCCFEYTIIDTKYGKEDYGDYWKRKMCETFQEKEAVQICIALNNS
jgi:hypothetical protein